MVYINLISTPIMYGVEPLEGRRYIQVPEIKVTPYTSYVTGSFSVNLEGSGMNSVQSGMISNIYNSYDMFITFPETGDTERIPGYSTAVFPIYSNKKNFYCDVYSDTIYTAGGAPSNPMQMRIFNFPQDRAVYYNPGRTAQNVLGPPMDYNASSPLPTKPNVTTLALVASTVTALIPANPNRYKFTVWNDQTVTASEVVEIITSGTLQRLGVLIGPGASYTEQQFLPDQRVTNDVIRVFTTSTGVTVWGVEWTSNSYQVQ